jgi:hypothetical protein
MLSAIGPRAIGAVLVNSLLSRTNVGSGNGAWNGPLLWRYHIVVEEGEFRSSSFESGALLCNGCGWLRCGTMLSRRSLLTQWIKPRWIYNVCERFDDKLCLYRSVRHRHDIYVVSYPPKNNLIHARPKATAQRSDGILRPLDDRPSKPCGIVL